MGAVTFYKQTDMSNPGVWYGYVTTANSSQITISNYAGRIGTYWGSFGVKNNSITGVLTGYSQYTNYTLAAEASGFNISAAKAYKLIQIDGNALGMNQLALSGNDNISGSGFSDTLLGYKGNDYIAAGAGNDIVYGGDGNDSLNGEAGDDNLSGGLGNDVISGGDGADIIFGEAGNDSLNGEAGDDLIDGGIGKDILTGGAGADSFKFTTAIKGNVDILTDFTHGTDKLVLDHAIFGNFAAGQVSSNNLVSGTAGVKASDSNDYLIFNTSTGALFYDADGNGKGAAIQFATLVGVSDLAASDLWIV